MAGQTALETGPRCFGCRDTDDAQHHVIHAQELADATDEKGTGEVLDLLGQSELHQGEHEIRELLGEGERHT